MPSGGSQAASRPGSGEGAEDLLGRGRRYGGGRSRRASRVSLRAAAPRRAQRRGAASACRRPAPTPEAMATRRTTTPRRTGAPSAGGRPSKWVGRCGECQQWGTVVEASEPTGHHPLGRPPSRPAPTAPRGRSRRSTRRDAPRRTTRRRRVRPRARRRHRARRGDPAERRARASASRPCCSRSPRRARGRPAGAVRERRGVHRPGAAARRAHRRAARRAVPRRRDRPRDDPRARRRGAARAADRRLGADRVVGDVGGHGGASEPGARGRIHPHPHREGPRAAGHHRRARDEGRLDRRARASSSTSSTWCASSRATGRRRCGSSAPSRTASGRPTRSDAST